MTDTSALTFLFTDIEGSTRAWAEYPGEMGDALATHDRLTEAAVGAEHGTVFKHMGDGIRAVFESPEAAVKAAIAAQRALQTNDWGAIDRLRVRMGVHTGQAEQRGADFFGHTLSRAERIMDAGNGDQIVSSSETAGWIVRREGVSMVDCGERRLPDLPSPEHLFLVHAEGLLRNESPLRVLNPTPSNLPSELQTFFGREDLADEIAGLLRHERLVTLTGVGGVGKTSLAIHVAGRQRNRFPDGIWQCSLAGLGDLSAVAHTVLDTIGATEQSDAGAVESIARALEAKRALLVLDNCEHLVEAVVDLCEPMLERCPEVAVLATSREPLGMNGEHVRVVPSLDAGPATALFIDRCRALGVGDVGDQRVVDELGRRLDRIPLALELAAGRITSMTPSEMLDRLDHRFQLLKGARRPAVDRHQTMRTAIKWSYELLTPEEQVTFGQLSVFPGSFTAGAAEAVCGGPGGTTPVLDHLISLVDKSMVSTERAGSTTRYRLLETMRQFGEEHLGDCKPVCSHHASYVADLAERLDADIHGEAPGAAARGFQHEWENIRAAVEWALADGDAVTAMRLIRSVGFYACYWFRLEVTDWGTQAVAMPDVVDDELWSEVAGWTATVLAHRGDPGFGSSLAAAAMQRSPTMAAGHGRFFAAYYSGDPRQARVAAHEMHGIAAGTDTLDALIGYQGLALSAVVGGGGDPDEALRDLEAAAPAVRCPLAVGIVAYTRAFAAFAAGRDDTPELIEAAVEANRAEDTGTPLILWATMSARSLHAATRGEGVGSLRDLRDSLADLLDRGYWTGIYTDLGAVALMLSRVGEADVAAQLIGARRASDYAGTMSELAVDAAEQSARLILGDGYEETEQAGRHLGANEAGKLGLSAIDRVLARKETAEG